MPPVPPTFPFVVGSRRSGTTLLRSIFDSHPDLAMPYEAHFVAALADRTRTFVRGGTLDADTFVRELFRDQEFRRMELTEDDVLRALADPPARDYPDAVRRIFLVYAARNGKSRYGDKMPGYVLRLDHLARLFPEGRFIHIIRDGRDVALSLLDLWFADRGLGQAAMFWKRRVSVGRRSGRRIGPDRYREVRYEALVDDPEPVVRSLCEFVELPFDASMLRYFERGDHVVKSTGYPALHQRLVLPPTKNLRDWRQDMSAADVDLFEAIAGDLLSELGYERRVPAPSLGARRRAWEARAGFTWERVAFHVPRLARRLRRRVTASR